MHALDLILTLTAALGAALFFGYLTHRIGLSPIVGYLLAGVAVGPHTPGFVANGTLAGELAEIGVILLMFGVGLEFHIQDLLKVRRIAVPGAIGQSLLATALGCLVAHGLGWSWTTGLVFGLAVSVASTVVLTRVLTDNNALHTHTGHIAIGWLVVEDLFTVLVLVLLPVVFPGGVLHVSGAAAALGWALLKIVLLVLFAVVAGGRLLPWVLEHVAATRSRELFTLTVLVLALGIAVGSAHFFGVSMALGAFIAGLIVGQSDFSSRAASEALPLRDAFAVLFFTSVGMLFDPAFLLQSPGLVAVTLAIILVGKPLAALGIVLALKDPLRVALSVAVALAQIGEFSFILAAVGRDLGLLSAPAVQALIAASIISISLNPLLFRLTEGLNRRAARNPFLERWLNGRQAAPGAALPTPHTLHGHAILIGHGPVGQTLHRLLHNNGIATTVIELNLETVRRLRSAGEPAVYGDATHKATLTEAGAATARVLILTSAGMPGITEVFRLARELNPGIHLIARTTYLREVGALRQAGADAVFAGEGEMALAMTEFLLRQMGALAEQIDREKDRVRRELFGSTLTDELLLPATSPSPSATPGESRPGPLEQ